MMATRPAVFGIERSLSGRAWRWRGGNMELDAGPAGLEDDIVTQLLLARGAPREDLARHRNPSLRSFLPDPSTFNDMDPAAERVAEAVLARETVTVYGDYDVDGATSAALLIRLFRMLGHAAEPYIPDRLLEGYGPSGEALVKLGQQGSSLVITVDCGAMAHEALAAAHAAGIDVIVVDHHKCSAELPRAFALVNPNRLDESAEAAAQGHLAAVGGALLLAGAGARTLRRRGFFEPRAEPDLMALLDLVALGTVADVAAIRGLNRAFVAQGLKVMARRANTGIAALIDASRLSRPPSCSDCGFALGPRINAGGRVGEATQRAAQRKRGVLALGGGGGHPGVLGMGAGRRRERAGKPAVVIALDDETGQGKGSGRSIAGVDLGAAIIAARDSGLLVAGGGHAMAAGLTVAADRIDALAEWLDARLAGAVAAASAERTTLLDLSVTPRGLTPDLVETLDSAGPFGVGWPGPRVAVGPVHLIKADVVGNAHLRLVAGGQDGASFKAIGFRMAESEWGQALLHGARGRRLWLAGRAKIDDWGSRPQAELHLEDAAWAD